MYVQIFTRFRCYKKERLIEDIGMIMKAEKKLHSKICRNKIIRECAELTYDPDFIHSLDENGEIKH